MKQQDKNPIQKNSIQNRKPRGAFLAHTALLALLILTLALPLTGCGSASAAFGGKETLDIDYVGGDGEVSEEEVAAKKESPMEWLKQKLSGDKKKAGVNGREDISKYSDDEGVQALYSATADNSSDGDSKDKAVDTSEETDKTGQSSQDTIQLPKKDKDGDVDIPLPDEDKDNSGSQDSSTTKKHTVTFTIRCDTAVANGMAQDPKWAGIVPASGCILPVTTMEFTPGETVFDLLCRVRDTYKLQMEYSGSNGGQYVSGINNLYEFDGGRWSGWMYCVNGWYPNYYSGAYQVKDGDVIEWNYTCDLGCDLENGDPNGYGKDWKDSHD